MQYMKQTEVLTFYEYDIIMVLRDGYHLLWYKAIYICLLCT